MQIVGIVLISIYYGGWAMFWVLCLLSRFAVVATKNSTLRIAACGLLGSAGEVIVTIAFWYGCLHSIEHAHLIALMVVWHATTVIGALYLNQIHRP